MTTPPAPRPIPGTNEPPLPPAPRPQRRTLQKWHVIAGVVALLALVGVLSNATTEDTVAPEAAATAEPAQPTAVPEAVPPTVAPVATPVPIPTAPPTAVPEAAPTAEPVPVVSALDQAWADCSADRYQLFKTEYLQAALVGVAIVIEAGQDSAAAQEYLDSGVELFDLIEDSPNFEARVCNNTDVDDDATGSCFDTADLMTVLQLIEANTESDSYQSDNWGTVYLCGRVQA